MRLNTPVRIGVIINPSAGNGLAGAHGDAIFSKLQAAGAHTIDFSRSSALDSFNAAKQGHNSYEALVVAGGDGMVHLGFNLVAGTSIRLGVIALGSGNDFARHLGLPIHNVKKSLEYVVEGLNTRSRLVDALLVSPCEGQTLVETTIPTTHRWVAGVVSGGFDSMVNARANTYRWPRGVGRYLRAVLRELLTFRTYSYKLTFEDYSTTFQGCLIAMANSPSFGGGLKIAPNAHCSNGHFDLVTAGTVSRWELLRVFPKVFSGKHVSHPKVRITSNTSVVIGPSENSANPHLFGDGEEIGAAPAKVGLHPRAVQILVPSRVEV